ncbi:MAG TPA: hypothetical protein VKV26_15120 [Dehalococcoidia bacterium]|nr:hypothetical protein [Dehalococcoidia bacterium]
MAAAGSGHPRPWLRRRTAASRSHSGSDDQLCQRLGGAVDLAGLGLVVPAGFTATPVAAGLTAPCALAAAADGTLYLAEGGHPRRTAPRLLVLDPATGVASVVSRFPEAPAPAAIRLALAGGAVLLAAGGRCWRVPLDGRDRERVDAAVLGSGAATVAGWTFFPGAVLQGGALYLCDPGAVAEDGLASPGAGVLWRVTPAGWREEAGSAPAKGRQAPRQGRRPAQPSGPALAIGAAAVLAVGVAVAWCYRERRARPA